jgi:outer membrane lipoprotein SlyB
VRSRRPTRARSLAAGIEQRFTFITARKSARPRSSAALIGALAGGGKGALIGTAIGAGGGAIYNQATKKKRVVVTR